MVQTTLCEKRTNEQGTLSTLPMSGTRLRRESKVRFNWRTNGKGSTDLGANAWKGSTDLGANAWKGSNKTRENYPTTGANDQEGLKIEKYDVINPQINSKYLLLLEIVQYTVIFYKSANLYIFKRAGTIPTSTYYFGGELISEHEGTSLLLANSS